MNAALASNVISVMPAPWKVMPGEGRLKIDSSFSISVPPRSDRRMTLAAHRLVARLSRQTGIPLRGEAVTSAGSATLALEAQADSPAYPAIGENESYQLDITVNHARLMAPASTGILRGLETFAQLVEPGPDGYSVPALRIEDKPRYPWRGLMLDVSRHWMPLAVVERNLDAMAAVKMNVFHWHLSDDQGFRVESKRFPRLRQFGSDGNFYSQVEVRHVIEHARQLGIRVVPEFDIPGHTTAWLVGYPELGSAPGPYEIERNWGVFKPALDPSRESVYVFLDAFIGEMAALFPDPYFHVGGDEVDDTQWKASTKIQAFAQRHELKSSEDLQAYFTRRVYTLVRRHGKFMIGWDEIQHGGIPSDAAIQSWRGQESLAQAARQGHQGILSFGYYLDHMKPASFHYQNDPGDDPYGRILGGEACMWTEYVSPETVDSRIWPRAAAVAERLWSTAETNDVQSMYMRLAAVSRSLDWVGVEHRSNYSHMLDRLVGGTPSGPVRTIADAVEALGLDVRYPARHYTSRVPLNRLVDTARPESERIWELEKLARTQPESAELGLAFTEWSRSSELLRRVPQNFYVAEIAPVAEDLSAVGLMGLEALSYLESSKAIPENWISTQRQRLDQMEKPKSEVRLAAVRPVRVLLDALSRRGAVTGNASNAQIKH